MSDKTQKVQYKNVIVDLENDKITEVLKEEDVTHRISNILKDFDKKDGVSIIISRKEVDIDGDF